MAALGLVDYGDDDASDDEKTLGQSDPRPPSASGPVGNGHAAEPVSPPYIPAEVPPHQPHNHGADLSALSALARVDSPAPSGWSTPGDAIGRKSPAPAPLLPEEETEPLDLDAYEVLAAKRRRLMRPKETPDVDNWGFAQPPAQKCDEALEAKFGHWHALLLRGTSFTQRLQSSRAFRNPSLFAKTGVLDDMGIAEYGTNWDPAEWDPSKWENSPGTYLALNKAQAERAKARQLAASAVAPGAQSTAALVSRFAAASNISASKGFGT
ncbi:hypothetical protein M427DRAFT_166367 [Gonapodya prolifera JEL478]|uniref:HCNGP-domain-containing protein n=1 Tax=Gonapodya prolifera (strain JEL478) TaxID=1344416 RepID=A0A139AZP6_GONPJ|nr:hypothetical protein M427DRAFT_166367 [Gonapodya prolifera JEL478]|eukprot:KXS22170.1 hypothetical protein M427DRAFT_166367 [Gonapodya prolifera JEL478]